MILKGGRRRSSCGPLCECRAKDILKSTVFLLSASSNRRRIRGRGSSNLRSSRLRPSEEWIGALARGRCRWAGKPRRSLVIRGHRQAPRSLFGRFRGLIDLRLDLVALSFVRCQLLFIDGH